MALISRGLAQFSLAFWAPQPVFTTGHCLTDVVLVLEFCRDVQGPAESAKFEK